MSVLKSLDDALKILSVYVGIMEYQNIWELMFEDANKSRDKDIKQRALNLENQHIIVMKMFMQLAKINKDREILKKLPIRKAKRYSFLGTSRNEGFMIANDALRLMLLLRKVNPRLIYQIKIERLKHLIHMNDESTTRKSS